MQSNFSSYHVVIIGTGVAGLATAIYLAEAAALSNQTISILLLSKAAASDTNTSWAQGGIAAVASDEDSFEAHILDTLDAGAGKNDLHIVRKVIEAAPDAMRDLIRWGIDLDKKIDGTYDLVKEGGHQFSRIWHKADSTGHTLQATLMHRVSQFPSIVCVENTAIVQIEKDVQGTFHIQAFHNHTSDQTYPNLTVENCIHIQCAQLVLATGGLGMVYAKTTNQSIATGDGIIFASQLGATMKDLSYIQFHPTGLYESNQTGTYLISEALRGEGAILRNEKGVDFMPQYDTRASLAPRDIVSRAIMSEIKKSKTEYVFLDATGLSASTIQKHFPNIQSACQQKLGIDICKQWIPVLPVEHYACGGIQVDEFGGVVGVDALYAIGEVAATGLHGANRLASNSLIEGIVFAKCAAVKMINALSHDSTLPISAYHFKPIVVNQIDRALVQNCLSNYAGIEKTTADLLKGLNELSQAYQEANVLKKWSLKDWENDLLCQVGILIFKDALEQTENKGVYFNLDL
ncbi:MAG: FAD-dependent oxidoreductase [Chitinophagaceae bacterium]|nr:FAD-dependent oxidoreductase [Chitinophagaceae bacterium]